MAKRAKKPRDMPSVPCDVSRVPVGAAFRYGVRVGGELNEDSAWFLVTFRIDGSTMVREMGIAPDIAGWPAALGKLVRVDESEVKITVVHIMAPVRELADDVGAVRDPVAGHANDGPLFGDNNAKG